MTQFERYKENLGEPVDESGLPIEDGMFMGVPLRVMSREDLFYVIANLTHINMGANEMIDQLVEII